MKSGVYIEVDVMHDGMPYDPIQGQRQGHESLKFWKLLFFNSISSIIYNGSWQMTTDC